MHVSRVQIPAVQRPRLLIVGCGDIGMRVLKLLRRRWRVLALTSDPARMPALRAAGAVPVLGNLDSAQSLLRLAGMADAVLHLAPPPVEGLQDLRTRNLLAALMRRKTPKAMVYVSTSGVYGDCQGARFEETRALKPASARAI